MDRRSFLKLLVAASGYAFVSPAHSNLLAAPEVKPLTIYNFGAGDTELSGPAHALGMWVGLSFAPSGNWFPYFAQVGTTFFFNPSIGQMVCKGHSQEEVDQLQGLYVFEGSEWLRLSANRGVT